MLYQLSKNLWNFHLKALKASTVIVVLYEAGAPLPLGPAPQAVCQANDNRHQGFYKYHASLSLQNLSSAWRQPKSRGTDAWLSCCKTQYMETLTDGLLGKQTTACMALGAVLSSFSSDLACEPLNYITGPRNRRKNKMDVRSAYMPYAEQLSCSKAPKCLTFQADCPTLIKGGRKDMAWKACACECFKFYPSARRHARDSIAWME